MRFGHRSIAVLAKRCPKCMQGAMFRGPLTMNDACASCGHRFMREEGFFQGAMFVSYAVGVLEFAVVALVLFVWLGPTIGVGGVLLLAVAVHLVLVPQLFQYSRVIWAHLNVGTGPGSRHS